jgi:hypothetical protein
MLSTASTPKSREGGDRRGVVRKEIEGGRRREDEW